MTTNDPDQIRADIERTRADLSDNVDALTEKVSPSRIAERQTEKVKGAFSDAKEKVFGVAEDAKDRVMGAKDSATASVHSATEGVRGSAGSMADTASAAPRRVRSQTQGNPWAAGLVAFGVGLLAAGLIPSSRREREMVGQVKESDALSQVKDEVKGAGQEMAEHLREPAKQAADDLKATATSGAAEVKDTAAAAKDEVQGEARHAKENVTEQAKQAKDTVQESRGSTHPGTGSGTGTGTTGGTY